MNDYSLPWYTIRVNSWKEFVEFSADATRNQLTSGNAYRGQSYPFETLIPSITRLIRMTKASLPQAIKIENEITDEFRANAHLFSIENTFFENNPVSCWPAMQHYGIPTRLLDWTRSPFIAAYFAVDSNWESDGAIWSFAITKLREKMMNIFGTENSTTDSTLSAKIFDVNAPNHISVVSSHKFSERMAAQQGLFTLCTQINADHAEAIGNVIDNVQDMKYTFKIVIPAVQKQDFLRHLRFLNITPRSLFPGLEGFARSLQDYAKLNAFYNMQ